MFMSNESVFLPAAVRDRIWDLLKERKVTQAELAARIGCSESSLSRFISGKTDKLGDENIIRIAKAFNVSTERTMKSANWACRRRRQETSIPEKQMRRS